jgi:hypothetical protein
VNLWYNLDFSNKTNFKIYYCRLNKFVTFYNSKKIFAVKVQVHSLGPNQIR